MSLRRSRWSKNESSEDAPSPSAVHQQAQQIEIGRGSTFAVAFLVDAKHTITGGQEGKIRRWRVEDGVEVGTPMDAGSAILNIAVSPDGRWIVNGTKSGEVTVWNAGSHEKVTTFRGHNNSVYAVDVSPDGTKIATGSHDLTACVWSFSTGERLLSPLKHARPVVAVKFSLDGRLIATAVWRRCVRIYDSQSGHLLVDVPIQVNLFNESLAWSSDATQLFALSRSGEINCLDVSTGKMRARWHIHSDDDPRCIVLATNNTFIAASAGPSVSFWDTKLHNQIGSVIQHTAPATSMAISANYDLAICGGETITLRSLCDILPIHYTDNPHIFAEQELQRIRAGNTDPKETIESCVQEENLKATIVHPEETLEQLHHQLSSSQGTAAQERDLLNETIDSLRVQEEHLRVKIVHLEENLEQLHHQLSSSQGTAAQEVRLTETVKLLPAQDTKSSAFKAIKSLRARVEKSNSETARLENTVQGHCMELSDSQHAAAQQKDSPCEIIQFFRAQDMNKGVALPTITGEHRQEGATLMLTIGEEDSSFVKIDAGHSISALTFTASGEYLVGGGSKGARVWRVKDKKEMASMAVQYVSCLAVSKDGRWLAAGTLRGEAPIWDAKTQQQVCLLELDGSITAIDLSHDSTRVIVSSNKTATIWDINFCKKVVGPLHHDNRVMAAKYSPQGDRIVTASPDSVRLWDCSDGRLHLDIPVKVTPQYNRGLLWSNNSKLFIISGSYIKQIELEASTWSVISEWLIPDSNVYSCIALPHHGEFIVYSTNHTFLSRDKSTLVGNTQGIRSIALSPDGRFLAIGRAEGGITIKRLASVNVPLLSDSQLAASQRKDGLGETVESLHTQENSKNEIALLEEVVRELRQQLSESQRAAAQQVDGLNEIAEFLRAQDRRSNSNIAHLEETVQQLRNQLANSQLAAAQEKDSLNETIELFRTRDMSSNSKIAHLEEIVQQLHNQLADSQLAAAPIKDSLNGTKQARHVKINGRGNILSVAFLVNGMHTITGDQKGKIRHWQVEDGVEAGTPMDAGSTVRSIAVSSDKWWVVSGTENGEVMVWNLESHEKMIAFRGHSDSVCAVDVSPDGTKIATGSHDLTACIWFLSTGQRVLGPLKHSDKVAAVKFSPDGRLIATATWNSDSVRVYDSQDSRLLVDTPIQVSSPVNHSLVWTSNSKQLFVLSCNGNVSNVDVSTGTTRFQWPIHSSSGPGCIAIAGNGTFIAASADSSVSFWDTMTHEQIGFVVTHTTGVQSMAISVNCDLVMCGGETITLRSLHSILPPSYFDNILAEHIRRSVQVETADLEETVKSLRAQEKNSNNRIVRLEEVMRQLQRATAQRKDGLNEIVESIRVQDRSSNSKIAHLEETVEQLNNQLADTQHRADGLDKTMQSLRAQEMNSSNKITHLEQQLAYSQGRADNLVQILRALEQKHQCEVLYAEHRIGDAAVSLLELTNIMSEEVKTNKLIMNWLAGFKSQCISALALIGDEALSAEKREEALAAYSTALSLSPSAPDTLLTEWAKLILIHSSADDALSAATKFKLPGFNVYRAICDVIETNGQISEAIKCFRQMQSKLGEDRINHDERTQWEIGFRRRCAERLETLGDAAMDSQNYNEAIEHFSTVLSLNPIDQMGILIKRSKARALMNAWEEALSDADEVIELDPSSHRGYETRRVALLGMERPSEAFGTFQAMLSKLEQSPDPHIRELRRQYVDATPTIRSVIEQTIRQMPRVLIDSTTGRLHDKRQQVAAFEKLPIYDELRSSMTIQLDHTRIWREVKNFYRYVMLSHRWEYDEPLFQKVEHISVYELEVSSPNIKLQTLCKLVHSLGFQWAWSDTCCIDKTNNVVLQESCTAMFAWYRGSSLMIVHLRGVWSHSQRSGDLRRSIWNTRAWTYQEYIAAEIVQFYTEDWKPYLGLTLFNHKESPAIILEMQQATGVSAQDMVALRPGINGVREKLYLTSMRQTTLVEDVAYSLFGIFKVSIPIIYGEGNRAIGRLLEYILTSSGDITILAWTGHAGTHNSCLPIDLTVYNQLTPPHIPQSIKIDEMDDIVKTLRSSLPDVSLAVTLHDHFSGLRSPFFASRRLRIPNIVFPLTKVVCASDPMTGPLVYHVTTSMLGNVEIKTVDNLTAMKSLCLVHPWIRLLFDQEFSDSTASLDRTTQALRFVARLRQPFGALLLESLSPVEYRRVATDNLIMVQVREEMSLIELINNVRTIDVL